MPREMRKLEFLQLFLSFVICVKRKQKNQNGKIIKETKREKKSWGILTEANKFFKRELLIIKSFRGFFRMMFQARLSGSFFLPFENSNSCNIKKFFSYKMQKTTTKKKLSAEPDLLLANAVLRFINSHTCNYAQPWALIFNTKATINDPCDRSNPTGIKQ